MSDSNMANLGVVATLAAAGAAALTYALMRAPAVAPRIKRGDGDLHRVNPHLQLAGRAKVHREATAKHRNVPTKTHVVRIALTGGPCAGKSSALHHLTKNATEQGFDVYCAPEAATLLFNAGVVYPAEDPEQIFIFQRSLCNMQLAIERNLTSIAAASGRPSIIIFDRGLMDAKGYMPPETWQRVLGELNSNHCDSGREKAGVSEEYCLLRYDGVVHLVTAADGAPKFYKRGNVTDDSGNTVFRKETVEEAVELDVKMRQVWEMHPRQHIIRNTGSFSAKMDATAGTVISLALESHPHLQQELAAVQHERANK